MLTDNWLYLIVGAVIIVLALAFYAGKLLRQLKQQTQRQKDAEAVHQQALKNHDKKVLDSVVIIVRAMKEEQCEFAEGCWRLSVLLDSLKMSSSLETHFPAIFELYDAIKHMPIHEERKQLEKKQRMKLDYERMKSEAALKPKIQQDLISLHQYAIERISALT